eukprot:Protomagalhaensia_sp_Gyna_25__5353@NODE_680_length_2848_cov_4_855821_g531_i0_p3_GENE_NODE_680_length_2848_cov_4_855821_g531_i0NODE_680_length_2848_cov_4_855821_g531_i0_p3_ORF_typecomplete_len197_score25_25HHH_9/PF17674_1/0_16_NODE_680_length_2848_cov_4_855821_g531_i010301620
MHCCLLIILLLEVASVNVAHRVEEPLTFLGLPGLKSIVYTGESWFSSGAKKHELKFKATIANDISKGDGNGEAASHLLYTIEHPEQYEITSVQATALAQALMNDAGYDINRARQNAQIYDAAKAATAAAMAQTSSGGPTNLGGTIVAGGISSVSPVGAPATTTIVTPTPMNSINTMATLATLLPQVTIKPVGGIPQ